MAQSVTKATNLKSQIQSKAQEAVTSMQQKTASSTEATQAGSTITPVVTETPKVTSLRKAQPSVTPVQNITPVSQSTISKVQPTNLLGTTNLRKAATPDLLNKQTEEKDVKNITIPTNMIRYASRDGGEAGNAVKETLFQQGLDWFNDKISSAKDFREKATQTVGEYGIDFFNSLKEDAKYMGNFYSSVANNLVQGLPRGISRAEYGAAELLDWGVDTELTEKLKNQAKFNMDYWLNTETYKKQQNITDVKSFFENPGMISSTFSEMLPMALGGWVGVPYVLAQSYADTYTDYANDEELSQRLNDDQMHLLSLGVGSTVGLVEYAFDLVGGLIPGVRAVTKPGFKQVKKTLSRPISNIIGRMVKGGVSEGFEEVIQDEIVDQVAGFFGSERDMPTWASRLTTFVISSIVGLVLGGGNATVELKNHQELKDSFDEWSKAVDEIAPGVSQKDKETLFSTIVAAQIQDANMDNKLVERYETQTTALYNEIENLNKELENTTDETRKAEITKQIDNANQQIQKIDETINTVNKVTEEVNAKLQELSQQQEKLPAQQEVQMPKEAEGENLSEQTMREVSEGKDNNFRIPTTSEEYMSLASALKQKGNIFLHNLSDKDLLELHDNVREELVYLSDKNFGSAILPDLKFILKRINEEKRSRKDLDGIKFTSLESFVNKLVDMDKQSGERYSLSRKSKTERKRRYVSKFLINNLKGDFSKHLIGLKGVNLKNIKGKLTEKKLTEIAEMLASISDTFGIDFNKVISDAEMSMNIAESPDDFLLNTGVLGQMTWRSTIDKIKDLIEKTGENISLDDISDIIKIGVIVTLEKGKLESGSTMAHELWHMIDFVLSTEEGLPLYMNGDVYSYTSIIQGDNDWKTYKRGRKKVEGVKGGYSQGDIDYYDSWTEILARYAEQFYAYINDYDNLFKDFAEKQDWYWTQEEFEKLLPKFESLIRDKLGGKMLDKGNESYYDVIKKLNNFKYNQVLVSDKKWIEDIKNSNPEMQQDALVRMLQMQKDYVELSAELDGLEGTISEEIRAGYVTELDNLATNMGILEETLQDYTRFVDKKVPIENFEAADSALESENLEEDQQQIEDENASFEEQEQMQDEMDEQIEEAGGIQNIDEWKDREKELTEEERTQRKGERKRNLVESRDSVWDVAKDILTPTMSRIYNINKRVAGRLTQMETQSGINIYRYTQRCQGFVDHMNTLEGTAKLEVTEALLNYGALASEQTEDTIEDYKREEVKKLREVLLRNGFKEKDINDMFSVLNDLGNRYKEAGLSISISDMYFPRVVKDYKGLIEYMSRVSGTKIEDKTKNDLMRDIQKIIDNDAYSDAEKEKRIRDKLTTQFPSKIKINSKHSEERKLGLLSEWGAGIYAYYENPTVSLAHYITTMEYAIQRQLFLGGQAKDLGLDIDTIKSSNEDSVSSIVEGLVERGEISSSEVNELQKCIIAVMDKKNTPRWIQRVKDLTYTMALTNYISAINQLEDIGVAIIENKGGLISSVKAIFSKAGIKYTDSGLESAYEMFRTNLGISNKLFAASGFNFTDRLGKKCFLNAAWTSMVKRAKNGRNRKYLVERLTAMYGEKTANHIMEKVDAGDYMTNGQIDIDVLTDLLYQLGTTQPIYASAMPVSYLRSPHARWFYALSMFAIRQADHIIQSTKQTYKERGAFAASIQAFWFIAMRMFFGTLVGDLGDWLMGRGKDETWLGQILAERGDLAWDKFKEDYLKSFSKLWMLSDYDKDTFKKDGVWGVIANKMYPYIIQEAHKLRKSTERAFANEDATELVPMLRDVPIIGKQVASWWNYYLDKATKNGLEGWETEGEKEDWETSNEKEDWETSSEKEDWE